MEKGRRSRLVTRGCHCALSAGQNIINSRGVSAIQIGSPNARASHGMEKGRRARLVTRGCHCALSAGQNIINSRGVSAIQIGSPNARASHGMEKGRRARLVTRGCHCALSAGQNIMNSRGASLELRTSDRVRRGDAPQGNVTSGERSEARSAVTVLAPGSFAAGGQGGNRLRGAERRHPFSRIRVAKGFLRNSSRVFSHLWRALLH
jgi:hypothetical protein